MKWKPDPSVGLDGESIGDDSVKIEVWKCSRTNEWEWRVKWFDESFDGGASEQEEARIEAIVKYRGLVDSLRRKLKAATYLEVIG
jgi:type IV secretory pathway TrbF-like protein